MACLHLHRCDCPSDRCKCFREKVVILLNRLANGDETEYWGKTPPFIPPSIKRIVLFCTHARASVRIGPIIISLKRGLNTFCLCKLHKLQRHWKRSHNRPYIYIPLGPTPFSTLVGLHTVRRHTLFFVVYTQLHTCKNPPSEEQTVPTLQNLAWASAVAGGMRVSDYVREWFFVNMPRPLLHDFPVRTAHRFGIISDDQNFLSFNQGQICRWTCGRGAKHGFL
jgi:hypothetical protein